MIQYVFTVEGRQRVEHSLDLVVRLRMVRAHTRVYSTRSKDNRAAGDDWIVVPLVGSDTVYTLCADSESLNPASRRVAEVLGVRLYANQGVLRQG